MRDAKEIVKKYRARGYSMESLRVLADSRDEPLRSEMLALLEGESRPGGETADPPSAAGEDAVFFVVSEEDAADSVDSVDFDIMAATSETEESPLAESEESVAEITIGETEGSSILRLRDRAPSGDGEGRSVWSKLWGAMDEGNHAETVPADPVDAVAEEPLASDDASRVEAFVMEPVSGTASAVADESAGESTFSDGASAEEDIPAHAEHSIDYMPGSVAEAYDSTVVDVADMEQAIRKLEETHSVILAGNSATLPDVAGKLDVRPTRAAGPKQGKTARKERRRQERAEKKRRKKAVNADKRGGMDLPEIVMTKREGTETLSVESAHDELSGQVPALEATAPAEPLMLPCDADAEPPVPEAEIAEPEREPASADPVGEVAAEETLAAAPAVIESSVDESAATAEEPVSVPDDFPMIIACGDMNLPGQIDKSEAAGPAELEASAPVEEEQDVREEVEEPGGDEIESDAEVDIEVETTANVILFRPPVHDGGEWSGGAAGEGRGFRLLSMEDVEPENENGDEAVAESDADGAAGYAVAAASGGLSPLARLSILRALAPAVPEYEGLADDDAGEAQHVVMTPEKPVSDAAAEAVAAALAEAEGEHQSRLDEFARRLLELQGCVAEGEARLAAKSEEVREREALLREAERKIQNNLETIRGLNRDLGAVRGDKARAEADLARLEGLHAEHERLYKEFEDLRKAYNEVVEDVLPPLQSERDELVLTVERQAEDEEKLRRRVKRAGRKVAVGYSLAAAASIMMVVLPLMHWMKSGDLERDAAANLQELSQWRERAIALDEENKDYKARVSDMEMAMLQTNRKIEKLENSVSVAVRPPQRGAPVKVEEAATLAGPASQGGRLRVNAVRDPSGEIDKVLAQNRERYVREDAAQMALRPQGQGQGQRGVQASAAVRTTPPAPTGAASAGEKGQLATVKKGEGVAQVVYRVLGSRDPEVIDWVIRENKLKKDRRGNPVIFPDQKLQLPASGRTVQAASAAQR